MKNAIILLLFVVLFTNTGSSQEPDYYPLKVGNTWEYLVLGEYNSKVIVDELKEENTYHISDIYYVAGTIADEHIIEIKGDKVVQTGFKGAMDSEWNSDPFCILQYPVKVGQTWQNGETICKIVSISNVTVIAGSFDHVCKIQRKRRGEAGVFFQYLAPGIGIIKEENINGQKVKVMRELVRNKVD